MNPAITILENKNVLNQKPTAIIIRLVLIVILLFCILIPLLVTFFVLSMGDGFHFGIFISYGLFWGAGFYFLRVILWNIFGKEIISMSNSGLTYVADYKLFKDKIITLDSQNLQAEIIYEDTSDSPFGRLKIFNDSNEIQTMLQSSLIELEIIKVKINTLYSTPKQF